MAADSKPMILKSSFADLVIPEVSFPDYAFSRILQYGDATAMVDNSSGRLISFGEINGQARRCASSLRRRGVKKGDVVGVCLPTCIEHYILLMATTACGATYAPVNPGYSKGEMLHLFRISEPRAIFCHDASLTTVQRVIKELKTVENVYVVGENEQFETLDTLVAEGDVEGFPHDVKIDPKNDTAIHYYSSGTTGLPKCVMLTHYNLVAEMIMLEFHIGMDRSSCFYSERPMYHISGIFPMLLSVHIGSKSVIDRAFDPIRMLEAVEQHKVTHGVLTPPLLLSLSHALPTREYDTSYVVEFVCGGAAAAPNVMAMVRERLNIKVSPVYGLTEMMNITWGSRTKPAPSSVGEVRVNHMAKVVDVESGRMLPPGENGEIVAKGPQMMKGYLKNPEATKSAIDEEGWFHTGDIGHYDENGMLYVVDRLKEVIKYLGFQVPPAELELVLLEHPKIAYAGVVGIPDDFAGEIPKAFVVKKDKTLTEEDVISFVKGRLVDYKHLRGGVEFVESIPVSKTGKINRSKLKEMASR